MRIQVNYRDQCTTRYPLNGRCRWKLVVFSGEDKFNLDGPGQCSCYWKYLRKEEKYFSARQKGGGGVILWVAVSCYVLSTSVDVHGTINPKLYCRILEAGFRPYIAEFAPQDWVFQQDNTPSHVGVFLTTISMFFRGLRFPQTFILSRTYGESSFSMHASTIGRILVLKNRKEISPVISTTQTKTQLKISMFLKFIVSLVPTGGSSSLFYLVLFFTSLQIHVEESRKCFGTPRT